MSTFSLDPLPLLPGEPNELEKLRSRVEALEKQLRAPTELGQLPLKALMNKLEADWDPAAKDLLLPGSVSLKLLGGVRFGIAALSWPGGTRFSDEFTISHDLGASPSLVLATPMLGTPQGDLISVWTGANSTQVKLQAAWQSFVPGAGTANFGYFFTR